MTTPVLVTGATGFVASHLIKQLLQSGHLVRGTVRSLKNTKKLEPLYALCPEASGNLELVEAELLDKGCWMKAVSGGVQEVYHVASPFPVDEPEDENEIIGPAVSGTLNVLDACRLAGTIRRVVLTSSVAAIWNKELAQKRVLNEQDWSDVDKLGAYMKSKHLAEKAAWDFMKNLSQEERFELVTVHPGYVMGPLLFQCPATSAEVPKRLLERQMPALPKVKLQIVDVRDVAAAHINAMATEEAAGQRHILAANSDGLWFSEIAKIIDKHFKHMGYCVPTKELPNCVVKVASWFDKSLRIIIPALGVKVPVSNHRMVEVLRVTPTDMSDTIIDMCYSLIEFGIVKKTSKFKSKSN